MLSFRRSALLLSAAVLASSQAYAAPVTFTELSGLTGGTLGSTAVFKGDLTSVGVANILSITIKDSSSGLGGSPSQFTGFDLDAIVLSNVNCTTAACVKGLSGSPVFDFGGGTIFTPGTQRPPSNPKLFGTGTTGTTVDNSVATLGSFDGESTTTIPGAFGFVSLGDNGTLTFNLTSALSTAGLFLYIGEVGNNGELAASNINVSDVPVTVAVPEPATGALLAFGVAGLYAARRKKNSEAV